MLTKTNIFSE